MADLALKSASLRDFICHHCNQKVSKSTWYVHYNKFFDSVSGTWRTEDSSVQQLQRPDFNFEHDSSESLGESERESDSDFSFLSGQDESASCSYVFT